MAKAIALIMGKGSNVSVAQDNTTVFYNLIFGSVGGVPVLFIVIIAIVIVMIIIQEKTRFGQYIYAIGDNKDAATVAGINTDKIIRQVFLISAVFSSFGGVLMMLMVSSGQPTIGSNLFLNSFTKLFLGAMLIKVGKTNVFGTMVGTILMAMLVNGLSQMGTSSYISQIITGSLLVVGVAISSVLQKRRQNALRLEM